MGARRRPHHKRYGRRVVVDDVSFTVQPGRVTAVLGAGIGALVRNTGGAVTATVLALIVAPPLVVQLVSGATSWVPSTLANVLSGVGHEVSRPAALAALTAWAIIPALVGLIAVHKRDVV